MKLKPVQNSILIQLHFPDTTSGIVLPNSSLSASVEEKRTKVEVIARGPDVTCCLDGDFLLLRQDANMIPVSKTPPLALIDAGVVLAVVLDDAKPVNLN